MPWAAESTGITFQRLSSPLKDPTSSLGMETLHSSVARVGPLAGLVALVLCTIGVCLYRLYLSPLARFPGDKLAALTGWVETYHDVVRGGQFIFKVEEWHAKYGMPARVMNLPLGRGLADDVRQAPSSASTPGKSMSPTQTLRMCFSRQARSMTRRLSGSTASGSLTLHLIPLGTTSQSRV